MNDKIEEKVEENTRRIEDLESDVSEMRLTILAARIVLTVSLAATIAINLGYI